MDNITVETPLLERMAVPPVFKSLNSMDKLAEPSLLHPRTEFPTRALYQLRPLTSVANM